MVLVPPTCMWARNRVHYPTNLSISPWKHPHIVLERSLPTHPRKHEQSDRLK